MRPCGPCPATIRRLLDALHQRALDRPYEDTIVTDATMEDLDLDVVASYRTFLLDANAGTELRDLALLELVQALGGARLEDGELRPTVCVVLLFGKPLALKRLVPMWRVDYIRQRGTEWIEDTERRLDAIDVRQPLLVAFRLRARTARAGDARRPARPSQRA